MISLVITFQLYDTWNNKTEKNVNPGTQH